MSQVVARIFDIDFIYLDLILVSIWIVLLLVRRRFKELLFGLFGYGVVHFTDAVLWYTIKETRIIEGSAIDTGIIGPHLFLAYFSFTYGMIMFSFAPLMFNKTIHYLEKILWAVLLYGGWLAIGLISQAVNWNELELIISRDMTTSRLGQILMAVIGYLILLIWKIISEFTDAFPFNLMKTVKWWYFGILITVGIFIHFSMESTLWIANIRPSDWVVLITNSLLEFNTGIPILFAMWVTVNQKDYKLKMAPKEEEIQVDLELTSSEPIKNIQE
ncbi:MAG: hypothetical protein JXA54_10925 [Candidatus Heimdallarchaeota archaeon]|nr:hypothetical protein [Candidatus Heimdallarchaeota archaeon]